MKITVNKENNTVTIDSKLMNRVDVLKLITWDNDNDRSKEIAAEIIHAEILSGRRAILNVSHNIVCMTYTGIIEKLHHLQRTIRHAICKEYNQEPVCGHIGSIMINDVEFKVYYDIDREEALQLKKQIKKQYKLLPENCYGNRIYIVDNMVTLVGPEQYGELVWKSIYEITQRVNSLIH